jgi:hypothetical protein
MFFSPPRPDLALHYYGGKILKSPSFISLYAGGYWKTSEGMKERATLNGCSQSIPTGPHTSVWREYGVAAGTFSGSADVSVSPSKRTITERNIQSMVASAIRSAGIKRPDGETVYTVFLPPGIALMHGASDSRRGLGGFHGSYMDRASGKPVYYAAIAYASPGSGVPFTSNPIDNMTIAASHEWTEAVTDPDVNRGRLAWYNRNFGEIGDIPIALGLPLNTLWGRIQGCAVQKEWSNSQGGPALTTER